MTLKEDFYRQFISAMSAHDTKQADIVKCTSLNPNFVSELVKQPKNHYFDTAEELALSVDCRIEIKLVPFTDDEKIAFEKENGDFNNESKGKQT